jgi:hypothetical protein
MHPARAGFAVAFAALIVGAHPAQAQTPAAPRWPEITHQTRPWVRWWWMGSAVNPKDLTADLESLRGVDVGGVEITPIYGVRGQESHFIPYLSPEWVRMLEHTLREGKRLDLGVDMATGSGWPFGGKDVGPADAAKYVAFRTFTVQGGERLRDTVAMRQTPLLRTAAGSKPDLSKLVEPISDNPNLQELALDQVRFPKLMPLQALMAYSDAGRVVDLTSRVRPDGTLDWVAPSGSWTLYGLFEGWHGKQVERAAPGAEGTVIDHFSKKAVTDYLSRFDRAFAGHDISGLRSFFNDSYEVDDASGQADWTPDFLAEFQRRRGYDLRQHLPALFARSTPEENARVRSDYRETISDLLLDDFTRTWASWAQGHGALIRDQAHGSPGNILDLYAAAGIPETEGTDVLRFKFATSAAHVTGKPLVSSESATWLNEHFTSTLADVRAAVDKFFIGGVNHIFYHGSAYSPQDAPWPGWLFYAAVHFEPTQPWWQDFGALNRYVARTQSFLQQGKPENDVLLYFPIYDRFADTSGPMLEHFDQLGPQFAGTSFRAAAETMQARGYSFDFISDRQIQQVQAADGGLTTGGARYRVVLLPATHYIPVATFRKLVELARSGATVVVHRALPVDVPGLGTMEARRAELKALETGLGLGAGAGVREAKVGEGRFLIGDDLEPLLARAGVRREGMVDQGLVFTRRALPDGHVYLVSNQGKARVDGWVPLEVGAASAALFDPMQGTTGYAALRAPAEGRVQVYLQIAPGESRLVRTYDARHTGSTYPYLRTTGAPVPLAGKWTLQFVSGGPTLPPPATLDSLGSWTDLPGDAVKAFSGTGTYTLTFPKPAGAASSWILSLGRVCESARVRLNGVDLGTLIGPSFQLPVDAASLRGTNVLEVSVSNLAANRIADMDRRGVQWKNFYNVNFPPHSRETRGPNGLFDASKWQPRCSGLVGPVTLTPATLTGE